MAIKTLLVAAVLATVAVAAPSATWLKDPTKRLKAAGLPVAVKSTGPTAVATMLREQFPILRGAKADVAARLGNVTTTSTEYGEFMRLGAYSKALAERNTAEDQVVLAVLKGTGMECTVCTWVIDHVKEEVSDYGCDAAEAVFGSVCAAIPFLDVVTVECVAVLKWGCGKLLEELEDHVESNTALCNDVFSICG